MIVVENMMPIIRVSLLAISIIWSIRFIVGSKHEVGTLRRKLWRRMGKYPQDVIIFMFLPVFSYLAFASEDSANQLGGLVCIALMLYMLTNLLFGLKSRK